MTAADFLDSLARFALQAYAPGAQWDTLDEAERERWRRVVRAVLAASRMGGHGDANEDAA